MSRIDEYRAALRNLVDWTPYLEQESHLPGPRGNLELAQAVALEGDAPRFEALLAATPEQAPTNTPGEFLAFCGVLGLGYLLARGIGNDYWPRLRAYAGDPRWRLREAVAMGLQQVGRGDVAALQARLAAWIPGTPLERRAVVAALCEPDLLAAPGDAARTLELLDQITASLQGEANRRDPDVRTLRQALAYGWSVAAAAAPEQGKAFMERWFAVDDPDVRWTMRQNLSKARLTRMDAAWTARWRATLG